MTYTRERYHARPVPDAPGAPGYFRKFGGWLREELQRIQRAIPWLFTTADARDFVTASEGADVRDQLAAADRAAGAGKTLRLGPRIYRIRSDLTLSSTLLFDSGAQFVYENGATITIAGQINAGYDHIFDTTGSGDLSFTTQRRFKGEWFGLGKGNDDAAILTAIDGMIPNYSKFVFDRKLTMTFETEWDFTDHVGVEFEGRIPLRPNGDGVSIEWHGPYLGTMAAWDHTGHCTITDIAFKPNAGATVVLGGRMSSSVNPTHLYADGFQPFTSAMAGRKAIIVGAGVAGADLETTVASYVSAGELVLADACSTTVAPTRAVIGATATSGPALVCIDSDQTGAGSATTTSCAFVGNLFVNLGFVVGQTGVRISEVSGSNCEYYTIRKNTASGWFSTTLADPDENGSSVSTTAASKVVTGNGAFFTSNMIGARIQIPDAGGTDTMLDTYIESLVGSSPSTQVNVVDAATANTSGVRCLIGYPDGTFLQFRSSNSMKHVVDDNLINFMERGIWQKAGAMEPRGNSFSGCAIDMQIDSASNPVEMFYNNTEQARQHLKTTSAGSLSPIAMIGHRLGNLFGLPNAPYVDIGGCSTFTADRTQFDNAVRPDGTLWGINTGGRYKIANTRYGTPPTMEEAGYGSTFHGDAFLLSENENSISDVSQFTWFKAGANVDNYVAFGILSGYTALSIPTAAPTDADIQASQAVPRANETDAFLQWRMKLSGGTLVDAKVPYSVTMATKTGNYTALAADNTGRVRFDCTSGNLTYTVATSLPTGWKTDVGKVDASANSLTVSGTSCTFNGAASLSTTTQYQTWTILHVGSGVFDVL